MCNYLLNQLVIKMSNSQIPVLTLEQMLIISGFTTTLCCKFDDFHADVEKRLGRPVFTHEFPSLASTIREAYREDFMKLIGK
jgi:hypothetical protein